MTLARKISACSCAAVLLLVTAGCASSGAGSAPADTPAAAAAPAKKAFEPPDFESAEYVDADYGFRVHYPVDFNTEEPAGPTARLTAASPMMAPRIDINVVPSAGTPGTLEDARVAVAEQMSQLGGGVAEVLAAQVVTLQDGVTEAVEFVTDWSFQGFPLSSIVLVADLPDGSSEINVTVTGLQGADLDELRGIAYTLYFD